MIFTEFFVYLYLLNKTIDKHNENDGVEWLTKNIPDNQLSDVKCDFNKVQTNWTNPIEGQ